MSGSRPAWMQAMFAQAYDIGAEAEIDGVIDSWMEGMPATTGVEDAFETVVEQGYVEAEETRDAYTLQAAANGDPLNCAGRTFATAVLARERHGIRTRPVIQYKGTAEDPDESHLCLLADRQGDAEGRVYGSNAPDTLQAMEDSPFNYEILDENGFYAMYMASEAYMAWHGDKKEAARTYGDRITALDLDSPYLAERVGEMEEDEADDGIIVA